MFDNFNLNFRKKEGFITYIPIPEYGQSNAPLVSFVLILLFQNNANIMHKIHAAQRTYGLSMA